MKTREQSAHKNKRKGIAIAWVTITIIMIVGIMAVMLEGARIYLTSHNLQNTADAAALVGARYVAVYADPNYSGVPSTNARKVAADYGLRNPVLGNRQIQLRLNEDNESDGDIVIGRYVTQYATDGDDATEPFQVLSPLELTNNVEPHPNSMKVFDQMGNNSLNAPLPMMLGKIFGGQPKHLSRYAIAKISNAGGAAIIALSEDETGLYLRGNPDIAIDNGGSIHVNSTLDDGVDLNGNALDPEESVISEINVVGDYQISDKIMDNLDTIYNGDTAVVEGNAEPIDDPYGDLDPPSYDVSNDLGTIDVGGVGEPNAVVYSPGYYSGGIDKPNGFVTLLPGVYVLDGTSGPPKGGFDLSSSTTTMNAEGVMLYILDGSVNIQGGNVTLSPPTSGYYEGVSIFQSRDNLNDAHINGNGGLDLTGALYFPNNHLRIEGNSDTIGTQLIADTIGIHGTGLINIPWDGTPEVVNKSYLVE